MFESPIALIFFAAGCLIPFLYLSYRKWRIKNLTIKMLDLGFIHCQLWNWLAKNPSKDKKDWPDWIFVADSDCRCLKNSCEKCPLLGSWEVSTRKMSFTLRAQYYLYSRYLKAKSTENWILASHYAKEIAKLSDEIYAEEAIKLANKF